MKSYLSALPGGWRRRVFGQAGGLWLSLFVLALGWLAGQTPLGLLHRAGAAPLVGNVMVSGSTGADGGYPTLKGAFDALNANATQTGNTIILAITADTTETASAVLNQPSGGSWSSLTIKPEGGAARTVSGSLNTPLVDLSGADNVTIDGLNLGGNTLTLSNTNTGTSATTIRFINDATNNIVRNATLLGASTSGLIGTVFFSTGTATGNDNNQILNCTIDDAGATPVNGIYGSGSGSFPNDNVTISGNNISDFFFATGDTSGIRLATGNSGWTISNNRIFQTAARTFTSAGNRYSGIRIVNSSGNDFTVTGNTIGYASAAATGTTTISGSSNEIRGVILSVGTTTASSLQGNTITAITQTTSRASLAASSAGFIGISIEAGSVNVGTVTGNTIGAATGTGVVAISATTTTASVVAEVGIFATVNTSTTINVANNIIGGVTVATGGTGTTVGFAGIRLNGATVAAPSYSVTNNTIGGTTANSIQCAHTGAGGQCVGILLEDSVATVSGNTIRNITHTGVNTGTGSGASAVGIRVAGDDAHTITQNTIHTLANNAATASAVQVTGIYYASSATGGSVTRNLIHSLSLTSTSTASELKGLTTPQGTTTFANNMIRLGVDASGASLTNTPIIAGLDKSGGNWSCYFNTVYIGGSGVGTGVANTFAFRRTSSNTDNVRNNIFVNARSNATTGGKHYAISLNSTTTWTADRNVFYGAGTGFVFGVFSGADQANLAAWQTATSQDANSQFADPLLVNPTGTSSNLDLRLNSGSPAANAGVTIAGITNDFDGNTRGASPEIGADEEGPRITAQPASLAVCQTAGISFSVTATGATGYQWRKGGSPLSDGGTLAGAATATLTISSVVAGDAGSYDVVVSDASGLITSSTATLTVSTATPSITPASLPNGVAGAAYYQALSGSGGTGPYSFALSAGALPTGLSLSTTGVLSGVASANGTFNFVLRVAEAGACVTRQGFTLTITGTGACGTITLPDLPRVPRGAPYTGDLSTTTPAATYSFALTGGALPSGLTLGSSAISGTSSDPVGNYPIAISATDTSGCLGSRAYVLKIRDGLMARALKADYDRDGRGDLAVFLDGEWRMLNSSTGQPETAAWGAPGDVPLLGDYDGDGVTDLAVFRPANGTWYIKRSSNGTTLTKAWGLGTDVPVPGDYDGDSLTDIAVWRGSEGNWYILQSSTQQPRLVTWGASYAPYEDVPVAGDFDGDQVSDVAVFRRGTGTWYVKLSSTGQPLVRAWGLGTDVPVPGDYDGDSKTDIAVWRGETGTWYIIESRTGAWRAKDWGAAYAPYHDVPTPGDYDDDFRTDIAVWRPADSTWYIVYSRNQSVQAHTLGQAGAQPVTGQRGK